jgi:hypothetical protein
MSNERLSATFKTWIVRKDGNATFMSDIPGTFEIEIRLVERGRSSKYAAMLAGTLQEFAVDFRRNQLEECKRYVRAQFKEQVTEWREL